MKRLDGKVAIVTGAARGMGEAICRLFAQEGATVVVTDMDAEGESVASSIRESGGNAAYYHLNVTDRKEIKELAADVLKRFKSIDILVNNAGVCEKSWVVDMPEEMWDLTINVNLKGVFNCSQAVLPAMMQQMGGRIVNIASVSAVRGDAANGAYSASKFGVVGFAQCLAEEVGKYNILVNSVCPGPIPTKLGEHGVMGDAKLRNQDPDFFRKWYLDTTPLGRQGTPGEIAKAVLFFASDDCTFVTGCTLSVSGGMVRW
jgi:3-oxoacyl-[acyl-carrier protein] reductase